MQRLGAVDDIGLAPVFLASPMAAASRARSWSWTAAAAFAGSAFLNIGAENVLRSG